MSYYEHLPIYKKSMDFVIYIENIVRGFSRYHKYSIGSDLRKLAYLMVQLIIKANNQMKRLIILHELRDTIEQAKTVLRLCKEIKAFKNIKSFVVGMTQIVNLSRQNEGWIKYIGANNQN